MFRIDLVPEAVQDLASLRKVDQARIIDAIEDQLPHQATQETRNRKPLRPNELASWERYGSVTFVCSTISTKMRAS